MALEQLSVSVVKRSAGRSSVQLASYQSGEKLKDDRRGVTHIPPKKRLEDLRYTELMLPKDAPKWGREEFWNQVESAEKRKDSQLARSFIGALPRDLPPEWRRELVREFAKGFTDQGMGVDVAIHEGKASDGGPNHHFHLLATMRPLGEEGFGPKNRDWNKRDQLKAWRAEFERVTNEYLEDYGSNDRIDMRSYRDRGIDRLPGRHLGYVQHQMEKRGRTTPTGDFNRRVKHLNLVAGTDYELTPETVIQREQQDREIEHEQGMERGRSIERI